MENDKLFEIIRKFLSDELQVNNVNLTSNLKTDLMLDSLDFAQLLVQVEKSYPKTNIDNIFEAFRDINITVGELITNIMTYL